MEQGIKKISEVYLLRTSVSGTEEVDSCFCELIVMLERFMPMFSEAKSVAVRGNSIDLFLSALLLFDYAALCLLAYFHTVYFYFVLHPTKS